MDPQFEIPDNTTGKVLVANDHLNSPPFGQSLVLMAEHDPDGAMGFIINKPAHQALSDLLPDSPKSLDNIPVFFGGPVQPNSVLLVIFKQGDRPEDITLHCEKEYDQLETLIHTPKTWVRAFMGYAGWSGGQLEAELLTDSWKVGDAHPALFNENYVQGIWNAYYSEDTRWHGLMDHLPNDPRLN